MLTLSLAFSTRYMWPVSLCRWLVIRPCVRSPLLCQQRTGGNWMCCVVYNYDVTACRELLYGAS
jgi:hypothetical protein